MDIFLTKRINKFFNYYNKTSGSKKTRWYKLKKQDLVQAPFRVKSIMILFDNLYNFIFTLFPPLGSNITLLCFLVIIVYGYRFSIIYRNIQIYDKSIRLPDVCLLTPSAVKYLPKSSTAERSLYNEVISIDSH